MKRQIILTYFLLLALCPLAQVTIDRPLSIEPSGAAPAPSAALDVNYTTKGFLPPRLTTAQKLAIVSPAEGLQIYNTDTDCIEYYTGTAWFQLCGCNPPVITSTTPGYRCGPGTAVISATASAGTINWYSAPTGGSSLASGASFTTPSISSTTTFYVDATANGCTSSSRTPVVVTVNPYAIGSAGPGGGIVFYCSADYRLETAPYNASGMNLTYAFGCSGTNVSTSTAVGTGMSNTNNIVGTCGVSAAAATGCSNLVYGGQSDWFLPSRDELYQMYLQTGTNGMQVGDHWSSSQVNSTNAYRVYGGNGASDSWAKTSNERVRCVRSF